MKSMSPFRSAPGSAGNQPHARFLPIGAAVLALCLANGAQATEPSLAYTVQPGDKLIVLSREMLVRPGAWAEVARYNSMADPDVIRPGQTLNIPLRLLKYAPVSGRVVSVQGSVLQGSATAAVGNTVGEGTRLQTGADSSVVVELSDGSRLQLLPASVAEVVASREYALRDANAGGASKWFSGILRLSQGAVETLASKLGLRATPLQIQTPTTTVGVRGTRFRVAQENGARPSARAEVLEGQVRADNTAQQSGADLPKGTGAVIDPARKDVTVVPLLPAPDLGALPGNLTAAQAAIWPMPTLVGATAYRVQVAPDAAFERIVRDVRVASASADLSGLPVGNWQVRVRGIDAQTIEGYDSVKPITIRVPDLWRVTESRLTLQDERARLAWVGQSATGQPVAGTHFAAIVALDPQLAQVLNRATAQAAQFDLGPLKSGSYYVKLIATPAGGGATESQTYRLNLPTGWGTSIVDIESALQPLAP